MQISYLTSIRYSNNKYKANNYFFVSREHEHSEGDYHSTVGQKLGKTCFTL